MRPDIAPGSPFPDYELPDHENVPRRLREIQGDDPLVFTRQAWDAGDLSAFHGWNRRAGAGAAS